jgi:hypothetical protein
MKVRVLLASAQEWCVNVWERWCLRRRCTHPVSEGATPLHRDVCLRRWYVWGMGWWWKGSKRPSEPCEAGALSTKPPPSPGFMLEHELPTRRFAVLAAPDEASVHSAPTCEFPAHVDPSDAFAAAEPAAQPERDAEVQTSSGVNLRLPPPAQLAVDSAEPTAKRAKPGSR